MDLFAYTRPQTLVRNADPDTSKEAAKAVLPKMSKLQRQVYDYFVRNHPRGVSDDQLVDAFSYLAESTARKRRTDLKNKGLVIDSGERRIVNGSSRIVWKLAHQPITELPF